MSTGKPDGVYVNLSQDHELSGFLNRRGYKGDQGAREKLKKLVMSIKGQDTSRNVKWTELDAKFKTVAHQFSKV